ncbi:hypothetical protein QTP88_013174 [Uroleucon formosanum]
MFYVYLTSKALIWLTLRLLKFLKPRLNPKSMMFDFEKAAMNALKYIFPSINIKGCFSSFHPVHLEACTIKWATKKMKRLSDLINYFEDTWIGRPCRRARKAPLFSINVWNCYSLLQFDIPRTNNSVEGWHNCFSSMLSSHLPSIWICIDSLKKEESLNRLKVEQYIAGIKPPAKKKYKDSAIRLKTICEDYENRSINDYLRGISYNFQYQI